MSEVGQVAMVLALWFGAGVIVWGVAITVIYYLELREQKEREHGCRGQEDHDG